MPQFRLLSIAATLGAATAFAPGNLHDVGSQKQIRQVALSSSSTIATPRRQGNAASFTTTNVSMKDLTELDDNNFRDILNGEKAVLIDACAPWCGPCKLMHPVIERTADKWSKTVDVVKYNVDGDNNSALRAELQKLGVEITSLPTLVLFKDGEPIASRSGMEKDIGVNIFLSSSLSKAREAQEAAMDSR